MKLQNRRLQNSILVIALTLLLMLTVTVSLYAYGATTVCLRWSQWNTASAVIGSPLLHNGTYYVYCMVDQPKTKAGAFGNNIVVAAVNDTDVYYTTGLALAWIGGYDSWNNYQEDDDDDSN